jgi:hypothetical protein
MERCSVELIGALQGHDNVPNIRQVVCSRALGGLQVTLVFSRTVGGVRMAKSLLTDLLATDFPVHTQAAKIK